MILIHHGEHTEIYYEYPLGGSAFTVLDLKGLNL